MSTTLFTVLSVYFSLLLVASAQDRTPGPVVAADQEPQATSAQAAAAIVTPTRPATDCDVCFLLDTSGSVVFPSSSLNFQKLQSFVKDVVDEIDPLPTAARWAAVQFGEMAKEVSVLTATAGTFKTEIDSIDPEAAGTGSTIMANGIKSCRDLLKNAPNPLARQVIVIISDWWVNDEAATRSAAQNTLSENIDLIGVGVGSPNKLFLNDIVGDTDQVYLPPSEMGFDLDTIVKPVAIDACGESLPTCEQAEQECKFGFNNLLGLNTFSVTGFPGPDKAFTPRIVSKTPGEEICVVNGNFENEIIDESTGEVTLISNLSPGPSQKFEPLQFFPVSPSKDGTCSGIAHKTYQQNQQSFAVDRCVRVFFQSWQIRQGADFENVNTNVKTDNCVVFRTKN